MIAAFACTDLVSSPLTYAFLHGSVAHLAINMIWLAAFGSPLANRFGTAWFLWFWAFTSLAAVALAYVAAHARPGAADRRFGRHFGDDGGGGAIWLPHRPRARQRGFCRRAAADRRRACARAASSPSWRSGWSINLVTGLIGFAPGIDDQIAWEAHIGGFLAGFLGIDWFVRKQMLPPLFDDPDDGLEEQGDHPDVRHDRDKVVR